MLNYKRITMKNSTRSEFLTAFCTLMRASSQRPISTLVLFLMGFSHRTLQTHVHTESSQATRTHSGTDACFSSSTMMLASRPSDCQWVDFSGPSSYLSRKKSGRLRATVPNICGRKNQPSCPSCFQEVKDFRMIPTEP